MDLTPLVGFRQPLGTEQWDITHQNYNWGRAEPLLGAQSYTSTTRPTTNLFVGRMIWETDTLKLMRYNGTGWDQVGGSTPQTVQTGFIATDQSRTSTTTVSAITGLNVPLSANSKYKFEAWVYYTALPAADARLAVVGPSGATGFYSMVGAQSSATGAINTVDMTPYSINTVLALGGITTALAVQFSGYIFTGGTAADVNIQGAQNASNATPTVFKTGSWLEVVRLA